MSLLKRIEESALQKPLESGLSLVLDAYASANSSEGIRKLFGFAAQEGFDSLRWDSVCQKWGFDPKVITPEVIKAAKKKIEVEENGDKKPRGLVSIDDKQRQAYWSRE